MAAAAGGVEVEDLGWTQYHVKRRFWENWLDPQRGGLSHIYNDEIQV